jgi:MFS family permease
MTIGTLISSLLVGPFSSRFGRKAGLWTASLLNFIATAIMLGTTSVGALYFARLLLGELLFLRVHSAYPISDSLFRIGLTRVG